MNQEKEKTTYQNEYFYFLYHNYPTIENHYRITEDIFTVSSTDERKCLYISTEKEEKLVLICRGKDRGKVLYCKKEYEAVVFESLLQMLQYLEVCRRKGQSLDFPFQLIDALRERNLPKETEIEIEEEEEEEVTESYILEEDEVTLTDLMFETMVVPDKLVIDGETIEKEQISLDVLNGVLSRICQGEYDRIELTNYIYIEIKKKPYRAYEKNLVFECEAGKGLMCYFDDKELDAGPYYENRNHAGEREDVVVPKVSFRGRLESEQHIVYNRGIFVKYFVRFLKDGYVDYGWLPKYEEEEEVEEEGFFSTNFFSNKNAYMKYKNKVGEFHYVLF